VWGQQRLQKRPTDSAGNFEEDFDQDFDDESKDKLSQRFRVTLQNLLDSLSQDRSAESSLKALLELVSPIIALVLLFSHPLILPGFLDEKRTGCSPNGRRRAICHADDRCHPIYGQSCGQRRATLFPLRGLFFTLMSGPTAQSH
jgi:hypothetical protein